MCLYGLVFVNTANLGHISAYRAPTEWEQRKLSQMPPLVDTY